MGTLKTYECNKCDYSVHISCGFDKGMIVKTNTMLCERCEEIVDIVTEYWTDVKPDKNIVGRCPKCNSSKFIKQWDNKNRPCPKCKGELEESNLMISHWD